jgi:tetratricopeptide (TPR) repeat protein
MMARPAAPNPAKAAALAALGALLLASASSVVIAQEPEAGPEAVPDQIDIDRPPAPQAQPARPRPQSGVQGLSTMDQAVPLDYKSIVERLAIAPDNPALLNELGNILVQHGRLQNAVVQYEKALRIQPDLAITWNNLGVARTAQGKFAEGESAYRRAIRLNPAYALAYYNLGANFDQRKNFDQALVYYQRAIEIDPGLLDVRNNPQIATNRHIPEILIQSYLDKGGSVVLPVQSMYPPKPKKKTKP